jgi:hypothetical protein
MHLALHSDRFDADFGGYTLGKLRVDTARNYTE